MNDNKTMANDKTPASVSRPAVPPAEKPSRAPVTATGTAKRIMGAVERLPEADRVRVVQALASLYLPATTRQA